MVGVSAAPMALFLLVDQLVMPDQDVSRLWYHEILLDQVPSPRIIVDSGSNSRYGINPELLESAFGQPTIVVADFADVPLRMKIARLEKYARNGDLIILPLEWHNYSNNSYPSSFMNRLIGRTDSALKSDIINSSGYYFALQPADKFRFVIDHFNLGYIIGGLSRRFAQIAPN